MCWASPVQAQHAYNGSSGYINTPSAHMREDGHLVLGASHADPYSMLYVAVQALPWLELSGRYTQTHGVQASTSIEWSGYGSFKDKSFAGKIRLWPENAGGAQWLPALAVGMEDVGVGTQTFQSRYVVASKTWGVAGGQLDASLGYGDKRIDGPFGGFRYAHDALPGWAWVTDYDRINFKNDIGASLVGLDQRPVGRLNHALEYKSAAGWSVQVAMRDGKPALNAALHVPFGRRSLSPKSQEPAPYISFAPRPDDVVWRQSETEREKLLKALHVAGFRQVAVQYQDQTQTLLATLASNRYTDTTRSVGRAMRILLAHSPAQTEKIEVVATTQDMPTLRYVAQDLKLLQSYFNGAIPLAALQPTIEVVMADAGVQPLATQLPSLEKVFASPDVQAVPDGTQTSLALDKRLSGESLQGHTWAVGPQFEVFFNDPSGAFKAALGIEAAAQIKLARGMHLDAAAQLRLAENITDVQQPSNSLLPHVRTDVAEYFRGSRIKINKLVWSQYMQPAPQWYARVSAGLYETMFAGFGGQLMFVPQRAPWSIDVSLDRLAQRDFAAPFKLQDYRTTSGLVSGHLELPKNITATVRYGRFLAQDRGARFELKRELPSGVQMGFWFSSTNGNDTTGPGTVSKPYSDKGIFLNLPFDVVSTQHSRRTVNMAMAPWTRDVGQMVKSPGDLRLLLERGMLRTLQDEVPWRSFGGVDAEDKP